MCPRLKVKDFSTCLKIKTSSLLPHSSLPLSPAPPGATTFNTSGCFFLFGGICLCVSFFKKKCYFLLSFDFLVPPLLFQYSCMALFG